jgi:hypothetical protein
VKTKYTIGLVLYEMAKQNEINIGVLKAFAKRLDLPIDQNTIEADEIESKLYMAPLNKRRKSKSAKKVQLLECLCKILGSISKKESTLADLIDFYFDQYGKGVITSKQLFASIKIIREIEASVLSGANPDEIINSYGKESREELRKDKEFYDLAFLKGTINQGEHQEMMNVIKQKGNL